MQDCLQDRELQREQARMLQLAYEIFERLAEHHFLCWVHGETLLAAMHFAGPLPWQTRMQLAVWMDGGRVSDFRTDIEASLHLPKNARTAAGWRCGAVDLIVIVSDADEQWLRPLGSRKDDKGTYMDAYRRDELFPLETIDFDRNDGGRTLTRPANPKPYLDRAFGIQWPIAVQFRSLPSTTWSRWLDGRLLSLGSFYGQMITVV